MRVRNTDARARVQQVPVAVDRPVEKVHVIWKILSHRARQSVARVSARENLARLKKNTFVPAEPTAADI